MMKTYVFYSIEIIVIKYTAKENWCKFQKCVLSDQLFV